jgi:hypothetical protein
MAQAENENLRFSKAILPGRFRNFSFRLSWGLHRHLVMSKIKKNRRTHKPYRLASPALRGGFDTANLTQRKKH